MKTGKGWLVMFIGLAHYLSPRARRSLRFFFSSCLPVLHTPSSFNGLSRAPVNLKRVSHNFCCVFRIRIYSNRAGGGYIYIYNIIYIYIHKMSGEVHTMHLYTESVKCVYIISWRSFYFCHDPLLLLLPLQYHIVYLYTLYIFIVPRTAAAAAALPPRLQHHRRTTLLTIAAG